DDKIMERAAAEGVSIDELTGRTADQYHADVAALGCLPPDIEPRATEHVGEMKALIQTLIDKGHAYEAEGHVLFNVDAWNAYGELSGRSTDEMIAGARVEVAPYKKNPMDFVLWKPSAPGQPGWDSDWGRGRPGWHIECSAMAEKHLGEVFDIHGGGVDLKFPHHENEIAQSRCAFGTGAMAKVWMHNGFLQVEGEKMSKSLGNYVTIGELLEKRNFGSNKWHGYVLRTAMLMTHYRQPIDWTVDRLVEARDALRYWIDWAHGAEDPDVGSNTEFLDALSDDLNTPKAVSILHSLSRRSSNLDGRAASELNSSLRFLGIWNGEPTVDIYSYGYETTDGPQDIDIKPRVLARNAARKAKNFAEADRLRDELSVMGVVLKDKPDGTTEWEIVR
ncbi:MAG: cysteine--tRNA ligase, partial [Alphaproteobacteria bacterium]|nr:cysteine--tRNA ligase [Alphaproteobacteria bacterium]